GGDGCGRRRREPCRAEEAPPAQVLSALAGHSGFELRRSLDVLLRHIGLLKRHEWTTDEHRGSPRGLATAKERRKAPRNALAARRRPAPREAARVPRAPSPMPGQPPSRAHWRRP